MSQWGPPPPGYGWAPQPPRKTGLTTGQKVLIGVGLFMACSVVAAVNSRRDPVQATPKARSSSTHAAAPTPTDGDGHRFINRADWEKENGPNTWPVSIAAGRLECIGPSRVFFFAEGTYYAVNGAAQSCVGTEAPNCPSSTSKLDPIWLDDPNPPAGTKPGDFKISIGNFITPGLALCEK
ncbi:MAG: DUF2511 domain-containing protein [Polyangiaceae bacterium]|nr:DUF2511 domain-containing protein [Polyangiaceae bacterium]